MVMCQLNRPARQIRLVYRFPNVDFTYTIVTKCVGCIPLLLKMSVNFASICSHYPFHKITDLGTFVLAGCLYKSIQILLTEKHYVEKRRNCAEHTVA